MKKLAILIAMTLSACGGGKGPAVPAQPGKNLASARHAFATCLPNAPKGGQNAVVGGYVAGVLLGGILVGPIIVASNEQGIRYSGEAGGVDRCLRRLGYQRRVLTEAEVRAINSSSPTTRARLLDHFVAGGALENFSEA